MFGPQTLSFSMSTLWFPWEHHHFWQIYDFARFWWNCTETTKLSQKSKCWFQTCTNSAEPHQKTWCVSNYEAEPWVCWEICSIVARSLFPAILERVCVFWYVLQKTFGPWGQFRDFAMFEMTRSPLCMTSPWFRNGRNRSIVMSYWFAMSSLSLEWRCCHFV